VASVSQGKRKTPQSIMRPASMLLAVAVSLMRRYTDSKLWGDGWGWSLYKSDAPDKQVAVSYKKDCLGCHIPAQKTDWIYTQGYPVLHSSK
jgi:Cytochrome P460